MLNARVETRNGLPRLVINGREEVPHLFFLRAEKPNLSGLNREQIKCFAAQGLHLYTSVFPLPFLPENGRRDLSEALDTMRLIIESDPEAKILLRVSLSPVGPKIENYQGLTPFNSAVEYCKMYPEDQMQWRIEREEDHTSMVSNNRTAISMASDRWFGIACEALGELHAALAADPYFDDHVLGYHIGCGETAEWFYYGLRERGLDYCPANLKKYREYLKKRFGDIRALEAAWNMAPGSLADFDSVELPDDLPYADRRKPAQRTLFVEDGDARYRTYYDYSSELIADRMTDMARFARGLVGADKLLVFFYGYYFELHDSLTGHFRLQKMLDNPDIDAFTSPISYGDRNHGGVGALMSPADSVTGHGKLWIVEDDIRTSNVVHQTAQQAEWDWIPKVNSIENLLDVQLREAGHMLAHNLGCWYMDLLGYGWHHHPLIWDNIGRIGRLYREAMPFMTPFKPDVAVLVDEEAMSVVTHATAVGSRLLSMMRTNFYRAGVKFGFYTARDYENGLAAGAKVVFHLNPFDIGGERAERLIERAKKDGATLVFMHGFGLTGADTVKKLTGMTIETLSGGMMDLSCQPVPGALGGAAVLPMSAVGKNAVKGGSFGLVPAGEAAQSANPAYRVVLDGRVQPLAVYENGALAGKTAIARCVHDGFASVFVGPMTLSAAGIREICRLCGAPVYCESGDAFVAGNGVYMIHTTAEEGERTLRLPEEATLLLWNEGRIETGRVFKTDGRGTATSLWLDAALFPGVK